MEIREGWKQIKGSELDQLGEDTVAQKIAEAEGSDLEKVKERLKAARNNYIISAKMKA